MANTSDILLGDTDDLIIKNGDFKVGDATHQNQKLLLLSEKGSWKQSPEVGIGIMSFVLDERGPKDLHHEIQKQFELDGMKVNSIKGISLVETEIEAIYED